jgi:hypothetical protein
MSVNYLGTVVCGSADLQTSTAGAEILDSKYINFDLYNDADCHIKVNGGSYIFIRALQGISVEVANSIKIQESGKKFNWIGVRA